MCVHAIQRAQRIHECDRVLIERYFARIGLAICLAILNIGSLLMLFGNSREDSGMRKVGTDAVVGALLLAFISFIVYFW